MTPEETHRPAPRSAFPFSARVLTLACPGLLLLSACGKEESGNATVRPAVVEETATAPAFAPPADGLLTEEQVRRFLLAHEALARVNDLYLDSLVEAAPDRQRAAQQALDLAREKATRKFGLDGFAEYRWILEEAPRLPENVRLLERMQVTTVTR